MKTRPFGSFTWGFALLAGLGAIFAAATLSVQGQAENRSNPRSITGVARTPVLGRAITAISQPALALGRYANAGQPQDLRVFAAAMGQLQARVQEAMRAYDAVGPERDGLARVSSQIDRSISLAQQAVAQPGAGLLTAGTSGSVDEVGAQALSSAGTMLGELLNTQAERSNALLSARSEMTNVDIRVWYAAWGAAFALLITFLVITAAKAEEEPENIYSRRPSAAPAPEKAKPAAAVASFSNLASQLEAARLDPATGLLNKAALSPLVGKSIEQSLQKGVTIGLIYLEIDGFKELRQTLGASVANKLLAEAGRHLKETFRRNDHVARLRDAEFAVLVSEISGRDILCRLEERIHEAIAEVRLPELKGRAISASVGLAMYPIDGYSEEDLVAAARDAVIFRNGPAPAEQIAAPASMPVASTERPVAVAEPVKAAEPEATAAESVEEQAESSLAELHALIGSYLSAAKGSPEKQATAHVLIGEFKKRG